MIREHGSYAFGLDLGYGPRYFISSSASLFSVLVSNEVMVGRDEPPAVRVYSVCDESKYLIVSNVPALGCSDELSRLFGSYGQIDCFKPMDAEDCEPFTDVYWIKFLQVSSARFAKRKLDESVFLGNRLQISYAPQFESLNDTKEKLEGRRKEVFGRIRAERTHGSKSEVSDIHGPHHSQQLSKRGHRMSSQASNSANTSATHVSSNKEYFLSPSMNNTVQVVREKLDKIQSSGAQAVGPASKKLRLDNRRRI